VNVSARQLASDRLIDDVREAVGAAGIRPCDLILELTESAIMSDVELAVARMAELRRFGAGLAVDDFGTGYSSLNSLRSFPMDRLKIDKSFVGGLDDARTCALTEMIVELGGLLDLAGSRCPPSPDLRARQPLGLVELRMLRQLAQHRPDPFLHVALVVAEVTEERAQRGLGDPHLRRREIKVEGARGRDIVADHGSLLHRADGHDCTSDQPQTSSATSITRRSFAASCSTVRALPFSVDAKPHCGDRQS
jgi:hypothetical protein